MYTEYFGLKEAPFSITPDPRFLYMSERHREALSHLLYGIQGGGFVQLTGEVGTGKTTICRCLLEQLPPHVDVALILNPKLTAVELLAAVCDELRISYPTGSTSLKLLVDALHRHLLDAHARGRRTVLIIDEAQNLAAEVLEQIRLLTNLETPKEKLLQIILIGQPELLRLLDRQELRQVAQRVTARYHLLPFSGWETCAYIRHRLEVAGRKQMLFSSAAMRQVHRLSGGIPRLINVICDRALLGAYAKDKNRVDGATARRAGMEVLGSITRPGYVRSLVWTSASVVVAAAIAGTWILLAPKQINQAPGGMKQEDMLASEHSSRLAGRSDKVTGGGTAPVAASKQTPPSLSVVKPDNRGQQENAYARPGAGAQKANDKRNAAKLSEILSDPSLPSDKKSAFINLYSRWGLDYRAVTGGLGCEDGYEAGLQCLFKTGTWNKLRRFNLPAIIELVTPTGAKHHATVTALSKESVTLAFGSRQVTVPVGEANSFWDGSFILLWKPPALSTMLLLPGMRGKDVEWLRRRLSELDGKPVAERDPDLYDDELKGRLMAFQRSQSLIPDGIVGEETLVHLSGVLQDPGIALLESAKP